MAPRELGRGARAGVEVVGGLGDGGCPVGCRAGLLD
jgi:hypothetical protein